MRRIHVLLSCQAVLWIALATVLAQDSPSKSGPAKPAPGSVVEDRAAAKLLEAGQARYDADEPNKAVEIWQSLIERYPRSRVRYGAHMLLGKHFLERERAYERARVHFEVVSAPENPDDDQRADALMRVGACYYHLRNYGKCFQLMRDLIDRFPASPFVNDAYYYIGLGHFQLGHYSRAIAALENVGTAMVSEKGKVQKVEAGKRLFVRIEDADLAIFDTQQAVEVQVQASSGDRETLPCYVIARHARMALGSIPTRLGRAVPGNGKLEIKGDDKVTVRYVDQHTADKQMNRKVEYGVEVVGTASVRIADGAFSESLMGVVLGKELNLQVTDGDCDLGDGADTIKATVVIARPKSDEEHAAEAAKTAAAEPAPAAGKNGKKVKPAPLPAEPVDKDEDEPKADPLKEVARYEIVLTEVRLPRRVERSLDDLPAATTRPTQPAKPAGMDPLAPKVDEPGKELIGEPDGPAGAMAETPATNPATQPGGIAARNPQPATQPAVEIKPQPREEEKDDGTIHTGVFRATILLEKGEKAEPGQAKLAALPGDVIRVIYLDQRHRGEGTREAVAQAKALEGNIGAVRVSQAVISDQELRIQTQLKTAGALTNIGNRYKEFGLKTNAEDKYKQALTVCEEIMADASKVGGRVLEETYVQLWRIYFEMERLDLAAAMCQRLQQQFPSSGFVDEALLQLAAVARKQNDLPRAIRTYASVLAIRTSPLRGEAQYGIAECYEQMAKAAEGPTALGHKAKAFEEFKKVYDQFPESGRVGDAVARMAEFYYEQKDYARAVEIFENVITNHPDAKFLDVILFNYGRCLYRMDRKPQAVGRFEQLLTEFPDSPLAGDAKKILDAMRKIGAGAPATEPASPAPAGAMTNP